MGPLIALLDGPLPAGHPALADRVLLAGDAPPDSPGARHAAAMAGAILSAAPGARILSVAVFEARLVTSAATLARALHFAAPADIVHCSLGLVRPDPDVGAALDVLLAAGRIVVAAVPARGGPVWPAAHPGVLAVQGDARCGPGDWSFLSLPHAEFGACPRLDAAPAIAGASVAAAHLTGLLAALMERSLSPGAATAALRDGATFRGRERRT